MDLATLSNHADPTSIAIFLGTLAAIYFAAKVSSPHRNKLQNGTKPWPPCLKSLPVFGSLFFLPNIREIGDYFVAQSKRLGPVFSFYGGNKLVVILNNHEVLREAFVKRAVDFADRPVMFITKLMHGADGPKGIIMHVYDAEFKKYHHMVLQVMKKFGFGQLRMEDRIRFEVEDLISKFRDLKGEPFVSKVPVTECVLNVMSGILFGQRIERNTIENQVIFDMVFRAVEEGYDLMPINFLPPLRYLPRFSSKLQELFEANKKTLDLIEKKIDENINNTSGDNFLSCYIQEEGAQLNRRQLCHTMIDLILAGAETSSTTLQWLLATLADYPDIQQKLRDEIDSVVERSRLPSLEDRPSLPYVEATMLEVFRYRTLVPTGGVPHATSCDTEVGGYFIPKGTVVMANLLACHMDKEIWGDPENFRPQRFLDGSQIINREYVVPFSLGKRSCLGEQLARQEVFLFLTAIIQHFYICPPEGLDKVNAQEHVRSTNSPAPHQLRLIERK